MKSYIVKIVLVALLMISFAHHASAAIYYQANGGSYWTQNGSSWSRVNNDGYCVSGRGPCGSSLWYQQWTYNHAGCGYDESGTWNMASVVPYSGKVSAWIDGYMGGTMPSADYTVSNNYGSANHVGINQNNYYEQFVPLGTFFRVQSVSLTDSWGPGYTCNGIGGYRVEFDEIKLEV